MPIGYQDEEEVVGAGQLLPRRLLLAVDASPLSDRLVDYTAALAAPFEAHVTVLQVVDAIPTRRAADGLVFELERARAEHHLAELTARLRGQGLRAEAQVVEGRAPEQILHRAEEEGHDVVVLSSHGGGGSTTFSLGGTASKVVHCGTSSLLVVPARCGPLRRGFERVFLPLDGSVRSECALAVAERLAAHHGAEVVLFHAVTIPSTPRRTLPSREDMELAARLTEHNRASAASYLAEVAGHLESRGVQARFEVEVTRRVHRSIGDAAGQACADLMVLSAHGESGDPSEQHGSVAEHFLRHPAMPTLVVQDLPISALAARSPREDARGLGMPFEAAMAAAS